jgi:hypothetical protein
MEGSDLPMVYRNILSRRSICTGTDIDKQFLRDYLQTRSISDAAKLTNVWSAVGQEICKIIAGVPWMLEVFLGCGYGRLYLSTMFIQVLKHGNKNAFLNIIQYEPLSERFAARTSEDMYYKFVWNHYVPLMKGAILDTYLHMDGLVVDPNIFLSIIPSLSAAQLEFIMNHPRHNLLYAMSSPYAYVEAQIRSIYKYPNCMNEPTARLQYGVLHYENAEHLWKQLKTQRRARNWRFMFWCTVLHSRMLEFREKYWALSSKHVQNAAAEFYSLSSNDLGKN